MGDIPRAQTVSIYEAVGRARNSARAEIIDLPKPGGRMALLRDRAMPTLAFLVWADFARETASQIAFMSARAGEPGSDLYQVVCVCCHPEVVDERGVVNWEAGLFSARKFSEVLLQACRANGIEMIFVRYAVNWHLSYQQDPLVQVAEATHYKEILAALPRGSFPPDAFPFVDFERSHGFSLAR